MEVKAGRCSIDFVIGGKVALEVDGEYWHRDKSYPQDKLDYITANGLQRVHVTGAEVLCDPLKSVMLPLVQMLLSGKDCEVDPSQTN